MNCDSQSINRSTGNIQRSVAGVVDALFNADIAYEPSSF